MTAILVAAFGLVGVIAGSLTSGVVQVWIAQHDREREARAYARLFYVLLGDVETDLERLAKRNSKITQPDWNEIIAAWEETRLPIARALGTAGVWQAAHTVRRLQQLAPIIEHAVELNEEIAELTSHPAAPKRRVAELTTLRERQDKMVRSVAREILIAARRGLREIEAGSMTRKERKGINAPE